MIFLQSENAKVAIDPASGGRIASLCVFGYELLVPQSPDPLRWGCYPMAPWAGRVRNGHFSFDNTEYQLPLLMPPHAIHGTVFLEEWSHVATDSISVPLGKEWPFPGHAVQYFTLGDDGLTLRLEVHADTGSFPCSIGWHPWFRRRLNNDSGEVQLEFSADAMYVKDKDDIPTGQLSGPSEGPWDDCFTNLGRLPRLTWPGAVQLELRSTADHWVIYNERDDAVCVEPLTGPPDALNIAPVLVSPGQPMVMDFEMLWSRAS